MKRPLTDEVELLQEYCEEIHLFKITCSFCGAEDEVENVVSLYEDGWKEVDSKLYQMIGVACPHCIKNKSYEKENP